MVTTGRCHGVRHWYLSLFRSNESGRHVTTKGGSRHFEALHIVDIDSVRYPWLLPTGASRGNEIEEQKKTEQCENADCLGRSKAGDDRVGEFQNEQCESARTRKRRADKHPMKSRKARRW